MLSITCGQSQPLEIDLDEFYYVKIERISKATKLPLDEITLWILLEYIDCTKEALRTEVVNYDAFEQKLQKLERDAKLLLADCREHNARIEAIAQMVMR